MNPITLLDYFVWNGGNPSTLVTPWRPFPSSMRRAELWIDVKLQGSANITITLQSSVDQVTVADVGSPVSAGGTLGIDVTEFSSGLGPWVRLELSDTTPVTNLTLSVWLIPKNE